jgi:peptide/nickel transport system permease protein
VADAISQRIAPTLILTCGALIAAVLIGLPLGVLSALKPYSTADKLSSVFAFFGTSVPNFLLALGCIYIFAVKLKILPSMGMYFSSKPKTIGNLLIHLILPCLLIAINLVGNIIKQTRSGMLETLKEEYIKTARAKGIGEMSVIVGHALRNALIPVVTSIGMMTPFLIGGSVIIEQIFSWPGLGSMLVQSITNRDYPTIMGIVAVISIVVLSVNTALDVIYARLDPRIIRET